MRFDLCSIWLWHLHPGQSSRGLCNHIPAWQGGGVFPPTAGAAGSVKGLDGEDHPPWQRQRSQRCRPWVRESPGYGTRRIRGLRGLRWTEPKCVVNNVTRTSLVCKLPVRVYDICCAQLGLFTIVADEFRPISYPEIMVEYDWVILGPNHVSVQSDLCGHLAISFDLATPGARLREPAAWGGDEGVRAIWISFGACYGETVVAQNSSGAVAARPIFSIFTGGCTFVVLKD